MKKIILATVFILGASAPAYADGTCTVEKLKISFNNGLEDRVFTPTTDNVFEDVSMEDCLMGDGKVKTAGKLTKNLEKEGLSPADLKFMELTSVFKDENAKARVTMKIEILEVLAGLK